MTSFKSIKRFLLSAICVLISIGWLVGVYSNFHESREQVEELFDAELAQMSRLLQSMIYARYQENNGPIEPLVYLDEEIIQADFKDEEYNKWGHKYERKLAFKVWDRQGNLLLQNHIAFPGTFDSLQVGYRDVEGDGLGWRSFTLQDPTFDFWINVAQREDVRTELTQEIAWHSVLPGALIVPFILLIIAWTIARGLSPLAHISKELKSRDYANLSRLDDGSYPIELKHLVGELNSLFERVDESYERERRFTADAAHELRTPLSIAKVHLQNILQISQSDQVKEFVAKALTGIDRLIHLVQQLLTLSRLDASIDAADQSDVDMKCLCDELIREMQLCHEFETLSIQLEASPDCTVMANESSMGILVRNLLDNACRYANPGTIVTVTLSNQELSILNQCSTIPNEELRTLTERFKRGSVNGQSGSGLGLSICQRICDVYGYRFQIENRETAPQGVRTTIVFPGGQAGMLPEPPREA